MINTIYFDIDGTIIDIKKAQNLACEYMYKYYRFDEKDNLENFLKKWDELTEYHYPFYTRKEISYDEQRRRRIIDLFGHYGVEIKAEDALKIYAVYLEKFENSWILFDDVLPALEKMKNANYKMGIISNGELAQQSQKLEKTGILGYFSAILTSSELSFSKPDLRIFKVACKNIGIGYGDLCYVGDDYEKDILPCKKLGIKAIYINRTNSVINDDEITQVDSFDKILSEINEGVI